MKLQGGGKGTLPYLAPEVLQEGTKGTEAVDMWAVRSLVITPDPDRHCNPNPEPSPHPHPHPHPHPNPNPHR